MCLARERRINESIAINGNSFSFVVTRINTHAQDTIKLIEEEIRNAKESPVVIILNARQLLLSKIKEDEIDKVSEILSYLNSSIDTLTYAAFYPMEKVMIDILIYRFFYIKNIEILYSMMIQRESRKIYPHEDGLYAELNKLLEKHKDKSMRSQNQRIYLRSKELFRFVYRCNSN